MIRQGVHIYEIGDHGAIIVIAKKRQPTNYIEFSWDEGQTWEKLVISEKDLIVENIIIEPNSVSQQFLVYGTYADTSLYEDEDYDMTSPIDQQAFLVYLDFAQLHEPQCKGVDIAGAPESDYELWTPHDGRFGENKCFLGMHKTFVRRKPGSMCYNGEEHETVTHIEPCSCADIDYECDIGYVRSEEMNGQCVEAETDLTEEEKRQDELARQNQMCAEYGYFEITRGYRKIPGNKCVGGIDLEPYRYHCSGAGRIFNWLSFRNILILSAIGAIVYYGWPMIEAVLLLLPIPDPKDAKEKMSQFGKSAMEMVQGSGKDNSGSELG